MARANRGKNQILAEVVRNRILPPPDIAAAIDTHAATILNSAARVVKHILDQRACLDGMGLEKMPLIVPIGEQHCNIIHQVHQMLIINKVREKEDVAVALEKDHNYIAAGLSDEKDADYKKQLQLFDREVGGALSVREAIAGNFNVDAPLSHFALRHMLLRNNIKVCFADAATIYGEQIDQKDPSTLDSVRFFAEGELPVSISPRDAWGMAVRNHHMAKTAMDFAAAYRIVILLCGGGHIANNRAESFFNIKGKKFEGTDYTLPAFFKRAAFPSVSILQSERNVPEDESLFVCRNLPEVFAGYSPYTDEPRRPEHCYQIHGARAEAAYLNPLLSRIGLTSERTSLDDWKVARDQCDKYSSDNRMRMWIDTLTKRRDVQPAIA